MSALCRVSATVSHRVVDDLLSPLLLESNGETTIITFIINSNPVKIPACNFSVSGRTALIHPASPCPLQR